MPNEPKAAKEKRTPPTRRQNAQDDHEGSAHRPEDFDVMNPAVQGKAAKPKPPLRAAPDPTKI